jgi:hypothetical protein
MDVVCFFGSCCSCSLEDGGVVVRPLGGGQQGGGARVSTVVHWLLETQRQGICRFVMHYAGKDYEDQKALID